MKSILLTSFLVVFCLSGKAQPGALDTNFGNGGKVLTNVDQTRNTSSSVLIQQDGKIIAIGYCTMLADNSGYFTMVRYNQDGSIDGGFGVSGVVNTSINGGEDNALSAVLQSDGKIILAGFTWSGADYDFAMIRYNTDGTKDNAFGVNGVVTTDFSGNHDSANYILLDSNGGITLVGYTATLGYLDSDMAIAKYNSNGSLDQFFGNGGLLMISVTSFAAQESAKAAVLQPDGKLVITGFAETFDPVTSTVKKALVALRLLTDGTLDPDFGTSGIVRMIMGKLAIANSVIVADDGKIVVIGATIKEAENHVDLAILRLLQSGILDTTFGTNGITTISFPDLSYIGQSLVLQPDKKLLAGGYTQNYDTSTGDCVLARFDVNGALDNTFGFNGKAVIDFQGGLDFGGAIVLQNDGKIVMAGTANVGSDYDFGLLRFENDVALPVTLTSFEAKPDEEKVLLKWKTSSETSSDYFEIQRSADGLHWNVLDILQATHYSSVEAAYALVDQRPIHGKNFYRLKMIDFDGSFAFSSIVLVNFKNSHLENGLSAYPNPTSGKLKLQRLSRSEIADVEVLDLKGNRNNGFQLQGEDLDLSPLVKGFYNIVVTDKEGWVERCKVLLAK